MRNSINPDLSTQQHRLYIQLTNTKYMQNFCLKFNLCKIKTYNENISNNAYTCPRYIFIQIYIIHLDNQFLELQLLLFFS